MGISTCYRSGDLFGAIYRFDRIGDAIRMHEHGARDRQHNVIVMRGSVRIRGEGWHVTVSAGDRPFEITDSRRHEIIATTDDAVILNMNLYGAPDVFRDSKDGEYVGPTDFVGDPDGR